MCVCGNPGQNLYVMSHKGWGGCGEKGEWNAKRQEKRPETQNPNAERKEEPIQTP